MARTGAERQAALRAKRAAELSGQRRLNTWISSEAGKALEQLAERYGVTMREALERVLIESASSDKLLFDKELVLDEPVVLPALLPNEKMGKRRRTKRTAGEKLRRNEGFSAKAEKQEPEQLPEVADSDQYSLDF